MLLPYLLLVLVAAVLGVVALGRGLFLGCTGGVLPALGGLLSLAASVAGMVYAVFAASVTHGGASASLTYGLIAAAVALAGVSVRLSWGSLAAGTRGVAP